MATETKPNRRNVLRGAAAAAGVGMLAGVMPIRKAFAKDFVVGFIYVGPHDDYGYNQAHALGAAAVKKMAGVKVLEEENVPEDISVQKTMESMITQDGATLLFPTSFGYFDPHILKLAPKYPEVRFLHAAGLWTPGMPKNISSYFGYIFEAQYINGIVAGHATKSGKLGFVAAKPIPQVLQNINAFTLGARSVKPSIATQVIFTGDWSMPVKEAEATNSMVDQGIDVLTMHVDSPKVVVQTAEKRGIMVCGYHASQAALAPNGYLTGAEWDWEGLYPKFVAMAMKSEAIPNFTRGGFKEGLVKQSPYGAKVGAEARKQADDLNAKITAGSFTIFEGPLKDNKGNIAIAAGSDLKETPEGNVKLESMSFLVDGVIGSTS